MSEGMKCPHCGEHFQAEWYYGYPKVSEIDETDTDDFDAWSIWATRCVACNEQIVEVRVWTTHRGYPENLRISVFPRSGRSTSSFPNAPDDIRADYFEACEVLAVSAKAAAAIARRCLQGILWEQGYTQRNLVEQIEALLAEDGPRALPTAVGENVDAVRSFGNFSAHRINDRTTLQIIEVDPEEAEWCLEIIEELLDHYYERPAALAARRERINEKLRQAGKPELKAPAHENPSGIEEGGEPEETP